ncbi:hypothetical protein D1Z90_16365 [Motilimonas pumila]|uniref:Uncharacterized protein n=1 Tax=Motilimonas pumila TaxID=2303987 RepID=A0A418YBE8_9GAMM|nr:hypothetical protein D1Z90_16365 [Motilimonas pumila]
MLNDLIAVFEKGSLFSQQRQYIVCNDKFHVIVNELKTSLPLHNRESGLKNLLKTMLLPIQQATILVTKQYNTES